MNLSMNLKDQYVFITGSSRGIGAEIARYLSQQEAKVTITYTTHKEKAQKTWNTLNGKGHLLIQLDVCDPDSIQQATKTCTNQWGKITALVNNAGITKDQLLLRMTNEDFDTVLKTNLYGAFYCTKTIVKEILQHKKQLIKEGKLNARGGIVNISSVVGQIGNPGQVNYVSSKSALEGMTRSLARELAVRKIRVNAIAPGFIQTNMVEQLNEQQVQTIQSQIPLKQFGTGQDIAHTTAFLLSAEYITGQVIGVNGGLAM